MIDLGKLVQACFDSADDEESNAPARLRRQMLVDPAAVSELRRQLDLNTGQQELARLITLIRDMNDFLVNQTGDRVMLMDQRIAELTRRACCVLAFYES